MLSVVTDNPTTSTNPLVFLRVAATTHSRHAGPQPIPTTGRPASSRIPEHASAPIASEQAETLLSFFLFPFQPISP